MMKRVSSCWSLLLLSTLLVPRSIPGQTTAATGNGGAGVTEPISPVGQSVISVANYGARGDGSADDPAAINAAMSACVARALPHNGCVLYFPAGVYITTGLTLRSYVNMKGDGWGASVLLLKPHTSANVLTVPVDAFTFSISRLTLDGNS